MIGVVQGSSEWHACRLGKVTSSRIADVVARTKSGPAASRANMMATLIVERLTGAPVERFSNAAMAWGTEKEPEARAAYEFMTDTDVEIVGFAAHASLAMAGASPDGLVGHDGLVEIKCPNSATHIETLLGAAIPSKYLDQMLWQMACAGRAWCDFVSYDPRLPESMRLHVRRVTRDDIRIAMLEKEAAAFLEELDAKICALRTVVERIAA